MTGDKCMLEFHLKQPGFIYRTCGTFTKYRERIQKFREAGNSEHLYRNDLGKSYFAHDAANSDSKDLARRTTLYKVLKDRTYEIARNRGYDGYQRTLANMDYKFCDKRTGSGVSVNEQLAKELHKPVVKKFKRRKAYAKFKDNIRAADLAQMESLPSKTKKGKYLLYVTDVFTKYVWVKPLKDKKGKTVLNIFNEIVNESNCKPNYGLIKEENFTINLCKNGQTIIIF